MANKKSIVRAVRDNDENIEDVVVGNSAAEILDLNEVIVAKCELSQLKTVTFQDFPQDVVLQIDSSDGFDTYLFHELELGAEDRKPWLRFLCHHPNKYWEGRWGLATLLAAVRDEVSHYDGIEIDHIDLEDDWKQLALRIEVTTGPMADQINEKAKLIKEILAAAEVGLEGMRWNPEYETNESSFCKEVISPLLRRMGFMAVRYLHGTREYGKDFTFSELSPFGHLRHYGLQAKAGDVSGEVNSAIDEILGQVKDAFVMPYYELGSREPRYISTFIVAM